MTARLNLMAGLMAVILLGYAVGSMIDALRLPGVDLASNANVQALLADRRSPSLGPPDVPVTVFIFTDYRCAVCRRDNAGIARVIASAPSARFVFKEWAVLGPASNEAARTALAAQYQARYLATRNALMHGVNLPVDPDRLQQDQQRHREAIDAELMRVRHQALALGLPGTPAYLIGRRLVIGALSERQFRRLIAHAAAGA